MTNEYYECHITMDPLPALGLGIQEAFEQVGWLYSCIDGDPELGKGVKCYATRHFNSKKYTVAKLKVKLDNTAEKIHKLCAAKIIRKKIELVVYDTRCK